MFEYLAAESGKRKKIALRDGSCPMRLPGDLIDESLILPEALAVARMLIKAGFETYIVGGGVRDLLLGQEPKDFDVSTSATPAEVQKAVKGCRRRLIGRRFRIVHCVFPKPRGETVIEVTTFRRETGTGGATKIGAGGVITADNSYGTSVEEDSARRDYTVNALYYSPKDRCILDFHGGFYDLANGVIDMIGDPAVRIREDPVRIIRAFRFRAKLGFEISERTLDAFRDNYALIKNINSSRFFEEVNKFFLNGYGEKSFAALLESGLLKLFLAEQGPVYASSYFTGFIGESLRRSDVRHREGKPNMPAFLYAVLLWPLVDRLAQRYRASPGRRHVSAANLTALVGAKVLRAQADITRMPGAVEEIIGEIWNLQAALDAGGAGAPEAVTANKCFRAAVDFMRLRAHMDPALAAAAASWDEAYAACSRRGEGAASRQPGKKKGGGSGAPAEGRAAPAGGKKHAGGTRGRRGRGR